jgi:hypothetical protein
MFVSRVLFSPKNGKAYLKAAWRRNFICFQAVDDTGNDPAERGTEAPLTLKNKNGGEVFTPRRLRPARRRRGLLGLAGAGKAPIYRHVPRKGLWLGTHRN